jgi:hypothetical protein
MLAVKYFYIAARLFAVLAMQDFAPGDAWVCRRNVHAPAGFTYEYVDQVKAGDIQVQYEDECPLAIQITQDERI